MSNSKHTHFECAVGCSVEATLELIGGKWKGVILYHLLQESVLRFSQLQKLFPSCTQRTLTNQLRALEADGFNFHQHLMRGNTGHGRFKCQQRLRIGDGQRRFKTYGLHGNTPL